MSSTYSPSLRIELIGSGDQAGAWGTTTDNNLSYIIDSSIAGYQNVAISSTTQILTAVYGPAATASENQAIYAMLSFSGGSAATTVYAPPFPKQYIIKNDSSYAITIYNSTTIGGASPRGTGTTIGPGVTTQVWSDGYSFYSLTTAAGNTLYPVGSIYVNASNSTNPGTLLGFGTWAAFGAGRVPVGFDATNTLFDTAEETGGSANAILVSHTHTATFTGTALGTHSHTFTGGLSPGGGGGLGGGDLNSTSSSTTSAVSAGTPAGSVAVSTEGSVATNANYQPYITVYMWKRTA
jgi:hypothetical protein